VALVLLPAAQANTAIAAIFVPTTGYFGSLHTATPGLTGANEVTGGSYGRQGTTYGAAALGIELTTNGQSWTLMPAVTVTYFGEWTLVSGGTYLGGGLLTSPLTVPAGASVVAAIGALSVSVAG
jgi:hypothetical protein